MSIRYCCTQINGFIIFYTSLPWQFFPRLDAQRCVYAEGRTLLSMTFSPRLGGGYVPVWTRARVTWPHAATGEWTQGTPYIPFPRRPCAIRKSLLGAPPIKQLQGVLIKWPIYHWGCTINDYITVYRLLWSVRCISCTITLMRCITRGK